MKFLRPIPALMILLVFFSCGKEQSVEKKEQAPGDSTDVPSEGTLLIREVTRADGAADSTVYTFSYDTQKKITKLKIGHEGMGNQAYANEELRLYRNSNGVVERFVDYVTYYNNGQDPDSVVYIMHLNAQSQFTYAIRTYYRSNGAQTRDSLMYGYNDKGLVNLFQAYSLGDDDKYFESQRSQYTYDAKGNITVFNILFRDDANSTDPPQIFNYEYDDKTSAANFGKDIVITGLTLEGLTSPSNLVKLTEIGGDNQSATFVYTYNNNNQPTVAIVNDFLNSGTATIKYYYQ
ncbi:MAG: hypothetical protein QM802_09775 [Agriterribacter sp.]